MNNDIKTLLTLALTMRQAQNRFHASATQMRFKEMKAAELAFDKEIEKWGKPAEAEQPTVPKNQISLL